MYKTVFKDSNRLRKTICNQIKGISCSNINCNAFIDHNETCFYSEKLRIYFCKACGPREKISKMRNRPKETGGRTYQSIFEADHAAKLALLQRAGIVTKWIPQYKISLDYISPRDNSKHHICNYFADFLVYYSDGRIQIEETKGLETDVYKLKRALLEILYLPMHPEIEFIQINQKRKNIHIKTKRKAEL